MRKKVIFVFIFLFFVIIGAFLYSYPKNKSSDTYFKIPQNTFFYFEFNKTKKWRYIPTDKRTKDFFNFLNNYGLTQQIINNSKKTALLGVYQEGKIYWYILLKSSKPRSLEVYIPKDFYLKQLDTETALIIKDFKDYEEINKIEKFVVIKDLVYSKGLGQGFVDQTYIQSLFNKSPYSYIYIFGALIANKAKNKKWFYIDYVDDNFQIVFSPSFTLNTKTDNKVPQLRNYDLYIHNINFSNVYINMNKYLSFLKNNDLVRFKNELDKYLDEFGISAKIVDILNKKSDVWLFLEDGKVKDYVIVFKSSFSASERKILMDKIIDVFAYINPVAKTKVLPDSTRVYNLIADTSRYQWYNDVDSGVYYIKFKDQMLFMKILPQLAVISTQKDMIDRAIYDSTQYVNLDNGCKKSKESTGVFLSGKALKILFRDFEEFSSYFNQIYLEISEKDKTSYMYVCFD